MKIAIVGFGLEGQAAYEYWKNSGDITICDINKVAVPANVKFQSGPAYLDNIESFDLIVRSPGIRPSELVLAAGTDISSRVTSNTNEFFRVSPTKNIIGITGTKGKGTTSSLIAGILENAGKTVHLGGNIGVPPLKLLEANIGPDDWVVLELSSFQLIDCNYSPHIGVCLMVVPEHLDWHYELNDYFNAKSHLFRHQNKDDITVYYADNENSRRIASIGQGTKIPFFKPPGAYVENDLIKIDGQTLCQTKELGLIGAHNWQNVCAAVTTCWQVSNDPEPIVKTLKTFKGLEHRLEFVAEIGGAKYFDDSFATTPEAATVAVDSFPEPKIVILGGSDKGASYAELAASINNADVRSVVLVGDQAERIGRALKRVGFERTSLGGSGMSEIVAQCVALARPGDVVLLSPACASFDMFLNYKDRGEQFKRVVLELASTRG